MEAERSRAILIGVRVAEQPVVWTMGGKGVRATSLGPKSRTLAGVNGVVVQIIPNIQLHTTN